MVVHFFLADFLLVLGHLFPVLEVLSLELFQAEIEVGNLLKNVSVLCEELDVWLEEDFLGAEDSNQVLVPLHEVLFCGELVDVIHVVEKNEVGFQLEFPEIAVDFYRHFPHLGKLLLTQSVDLVFQTLCVFIVDEFELPIGDVCSESGQVLEEIPLMGFFQGVFQVLQLSLQFFCLFLVLFVFVGFDQFERLLSFADLRKDLLHHPVFEQVVFHFRLFQQPNYLLPEEMDDGEVLIVIVKVMVSESVQTAHDWDTFLEQPLHVVDDVLAAVVVLGGVELLLIDHFPQIWVEDKVLHLADYFLTLVETGLLPVEFRGLQLVLEFASEFGSKLDCLFN